MQFAGGGPGRVRRVGAPKVIWERHGSPRRRTSNMSEAPEVRSSIGTRRKAASQTHCNHEVPLGHVSWVVFTFRNPPLDSLTGDGRHGTPDGTLSVLPSEAVAAHAVYFWQCVLVKFCSISPALVRLRA